MIDGKDIEKLALLARIAITPEERDTFLAEIDPILAYVAQVNKATGQGSLTDIGLVKNVLRDDTHPHDSGIYSADILAQAPSREGNYVKVKKILS